jgi:hypothetical protein
VFDDQVHRVNLKLLNILADGILGYVVDLIEVCGCISSRLSVALQRVFLILYMTHGSTDFVLAPEMYCKAALTKGQFSRRGLRNGRS